MGSLLADLSKHKRYEIRLSVYNAVGEGPSSAPQEVFVGEAGMFLLLLCSMCATYLLIFNVNQVTYKKSYYYLYSAPF